MIYLSVNQTKHVATLYTKKLQNANQKNKKRLSKIEIYSVCGLEDSNSKEVNFSQIDKQI